MRLELQMRINRAQHELRAYAADLLESASPASTPTRRGRRMPWLVVTSSALFVVANVGLATAADRAVPGDFLYPVDRAYEQVETVFGASVTQERISEAAVLLQRGETLDAIGLLAEGAAPIDENISDGILALGRRLSSYQTDAGHETGDDVLILALVDAMRTGDPESPEWRLDVARELAAVDTVVAAAFVPPGQDDGSVPPGQDDGSVPPGQDDEFVPPGQDDEFVPPGQDDGSVPPGQAKKKTEGGDEL